MAQRNRAAVKRRVLTAAEWALRDSPFEAFYSYSSDLPDSALFLGPVVGPTEPESVGANMIQTDRFTITGGIEAHGYNTDQEAEEGVEEAFRLFEAVLRECKRLRHPDLPVDEPADFDGVVSVVVDEITGPGMWLPDSGEPFGVLQFTLACTSNLP